MLGWARPYQRRLLAGDVSAGVIVAMMMVPQAMAYAMVAGLPPVVGLYASIVPPLLYALFGTSMTQSVGPMAIISLMTASSLAPLAVPGSALYGVLAAQLALMSGGLLLLCAVARVGFLANFFSRPVMSGFTLGSALLIAWGQLAALLGTGAPHALPIVPMVSSFAGLSVHPASAAFGILSALALLWARRSLASLLRRAGLAPGAASIGARLAPMLVVVVASAVVALAPGLAAGVATIGAVPAGLPTLNLATASSYWSALLQPALLIGFMIFLISMSSAQALAQAGGRAGDEPAPAPVKPAANLELLGLGVANIGSALSGGLPVTGSMSRGAVNHAAGANTPLASIISAALLALALVAPTGYLALVPMPTLAATIIVAVLGMLELETLRTALRYDRSDALALAGTAGGVLVAGVEAGVVIGVLLSMGTLIWRASRPHIAVLGRIAGSEHFRNVERYPGGTAPSVLLLRVDAFLFFGNIDAVSARIDDELAARPGLRHLVLVLSAVNAIDTSALFGLADINRQLAARGVLLHLAEVKGPVMDRLKAVKLLESISGNVYLSTANAWDALTKA
ncbi:SulP family inorganic anion transporter [Massilia sp. DWR3-1-1]|uniref:SulP family inorganic anion transporter n=1 Tax=Massilia sp. DWR3-1-1 TaxID=2804559 RepID=UPI003CEF57D2